MNEERELTSRTAGKRSDKARRLLGWAIILQLLTVPVWYWLLSGKSAWHYLTHYGWAGLTKAWILETSFSFLVLTGGIWLAYFTTRTVSKREGVQIALMTLLLPVSFALMAVVTVVIAVVVFDMPIVSKG